VALCLEEAEHLRAAVHRANRQGLPLASPGPARNTAVALRTVCRSSAGLGNLTGGRLAAALAALAAADAAAAAAGGEGLAGREECGAAGAGAAFGLDGLIFDQSMGFSNGPGLQQVRGSMCVCVWRRGQRFRK
jgi:hypothetical protein